MNRRDFLAALASAAAAGPVAALSQQRPPVIGFMSGRSPEDSAYLVDAFKQGLAEGGFPGDSVAIEYRWAEGDYARLPALASELVKLPVAVLVAVGGNPSAMAARQATSTVPIVFGMGGDPVGAGLVASMNRPGGNVTGFTLLTNQMEAKRLGLLHDLVPHRSVIGVILDPNFAPAANQMTQVENAARTIGQPLFVANAGNDAELTTAFEGLLQHKIGAMLVAASPFFDTRRERIIAFAADHQIPAMYQFREYAIAGGLLSYGPSITDSYRQAGIYAARILKEAKPAELPVLQPTKFELVINLNTAKALGLTVPQLLLVQADEVIE
ncbi:MAG TPA: ABC transporter substrate-binding protein [Stellaceae bacterium]|jgi:putative ABC transport system substrate-binding protein|nr:ABC transporter substrate-binding protein [Stellaceae bacterium]